MTLDPRAQLAQTMQIGLANRKKPTASKKLHPPRERHPHETQHAQQAMDALTKALLDPCTTVQEAMLESRVERSKRESS
ncbi:hypothetical protein [Candidatus Nitronereus thalassa]|uniref:Uncharacterized protein n=1 Tax=Candidatus Nitronereus thalassa TaxID=3020898 RepID=A0ABU3K9F7_9BACT|nr:hypothetical protein [Candidatus Nitronereus thalassa]MDT7042938.1 hypothetical protein [Candidatus Nitronereus thalassa]